MTTMLERAARAAEDEFWKPCSENLRWAKIARAVLMAVREPDETLSAATRATEGWESMIDAILEGK